MSASPLSENKQIYDDMVHYLKLKLQQPFTATKIVMLVASGVKFLAKVKSLTGAEKKDLVLHALREVVQHSSSEAEKEEVLMLIDTFGDSLIDKLVDFASDGLTFVKRKGKALFGKCCGAGEANATSHDRAVALGQSRNLEEYEILKRYLKLKLQRPVTPTKVITLIAAGVKYIEHYKDLSGTEKKDIVIHAIRDVIEECDFLSEDDKKEFTNVIDTFADDTIDYLVDFGKKLYLKTKNGLCC